MWNHGNSNGFSIAIFGYFFLQLSQPWHSFDLQIIPLASWYIQISRHSGRVPADYEGIPFIL